MALYVTEDGKIVERPDSMEQGASSVPAGPPSRLTDQEYSRLYDAAMDLKYGEDVIVLCPYCKSEVFTDELDYRGNLTCVVCDFKGPFELFNVA